MEQLQLNAVAASGDGKAITRVVKMIERSLAQ